MVSFMSAVVRLAFGIALLPHRPVALGVDPCHRELVMVDEGADLLIRDPRNGKAAIGVAGTEVATSARELATAANSTNSTHPNCTYSFTEVGLQAVKCGEQNVLGCYLDKNCFWTLYYGHLVKRSASIDTYKECCALVESGVTPDELLDQDVNAAIGRVNSLLRRNTKFCKNGALELTQGEYDALVFASFNGAVFAGDFLKDKSYLLGRVTKRTKKSGGAKRVGLLNTLWYGRTLSCSFDPWGPDAPSLQRRCSNCTRRTSDKEDDKLCLAAKKKQCCPPKDSSSQWTGGDCCKGDFNVSDPSTWWDFCGGGQDCGCSTTIEGDGKFCWNNDLCQDLSHCTSSAQCPVGYKCIPNTNCDVPLCMRPCATGSGPSSPSPAPTTVDVCDVSAPTALVCF